MNEKDLVGVTLGSCTIERVVGKGGMAIVFLAQQARPTRTVAVKVLLPSTNENDPEQQRIFLERFRREADTIAKLEHKNILPVYEYAEATINGQSIAYLVMPYVRGGTLRQHIDDIKYNGRYFDLQTVASYVGQIAEALHYAHSLGVIHRDIKPGNLLFHNDGRLLLSDFGIVRLSAMPSLTLVGSFIGTAEYASPEQVSAGELDSRSDIYSLGVILYELLTNSVPFTGPTPFAIMSRQLHDPVPSVRAQRPDLSPAIEFVVKKALAKDPKDRYQHAAELAADLQVAVTPALVRPAGLRLGGDAGGNSDLTVADGSWQPPAPRALGPTSPMPRIADVPAQQITPPISLVPTDKPLPTTKPAGQQAGPAISPLAPVVSEAANLATPSQLQAQFRQNKPEAEEEEQEQTFRPGRRILIMIISIVALFLQFVILGLIVNHNFQFSNDSNSATGLGILMGNALNLLILAAIGFTGITRQRSIRNIFTRAFWATLMALILSGFFISYGQFSPTDLPFISYAILLLTNLFSVRELSKVDKREPVEVAPIAWRAALAGALTGLIPLIIILSFSLTMPLSWAAGNSFFLRLLGVLVIGLIGAPTPGAMMAVWLSRKMSFPILARTSAFSGFFMFVAAYILVAVVGWLVTGQPLFSDNFKQQPLLPVIIVGVSLGLIGFLRGLLDAWVYHRVMMRHP